MKVALVILFALSAFVFAVDERRLGNPDFVLVNDTLSAQFVECDRLVSTPTDNDPTVAIYNGYRLITRSLTACANGHRLLRVAEFDTGVGSRPVPHFWSQSMVKNFKTDTTISLGFQTFLVFDRFGEYDEVGGHPGFDPKGDNDTLVYFVDLFTNRLATPLFSTVSVTKGFLIGSNGTDADAFYTLSFSNMPGAFPSHPNLNLTFTVDVVPKVARFGNKVLTPDSFKLTVNANNVDYLNATTAGGAYLGAYLVTVKTVRDMVKGNPVSVESPGTASNETTNVDIDDGSTDNDKGFFSFDIKAFGTGPSKLVNVVAIRSVTEDVDLPYFDEFLQVVGRRIHFSTTTKESSIEWDPNLGIYDIPVTQSTSSSSQTVVSFVVKAFSLLFVALALVL